MEGKFNRKKIVAEIISSGRIHTQEELSDAMKERGILVGQATLSRDIKELGAVKVPDVFGNTYYKMPQVGHPRSGLPVTGMEISGQLCIMKCRPGFASAIASVIDASKIDNVMGTIAGDDTILVMFREGADVQLLEETMHIIFNFG
ncbi:MAG: hypothetical protein MJY62_03860 [Bacteroidales bacterium]|nr:hypothetical protein [Bacteroidales bacterium]